jgi:HlyD family secretion protein
MRLRLCITLLLAFSLAGCSVLNKATPTPLPTVVLDQPGSPPSDSPPTSMPAAENPPADVTSTPDSGAQAGGNAQGGSVSASAEIVPALTADLSFASPCFVQGLTVTEGDVVQAGEVLASQDNIPQLQSALTAAQQALTSAQKDYDQLLVNVPVERANAQLALVKAERALEDAQKTSRNKQYQRASPETIDLARARLIVANQALDDAQEEFNKVASRNTEDQVYAAGLSSLAKARQEQVKAQYNLNYVLGLASPLDIEEASANVSLAQADLLAAKDAWEQVKDGDPDAQAAASVQARISSAQSSLDTAQLAIARSALHSPFGGTVINVAITPGQAVNPGQTVLTIADLNTLQVETTDLSERDIARVRLGQPASVTIEGLNATQLGEVIKIATRSTKVGGDVVYKVTIRLDSRPEGLRWGMSATVQIGP